jgi:hypothetical protein
MVSAAALMSSCVSLFGSTGLPALMRWPILMIETSSENSVLEQIPGELLRVHLVGAVRERREADVEGHVVDQAVGADARVADRLRDALVVRQQRRVERLDQAGGLVVRPVGDARVDQVVLDT